MAPSDYELDDDYEEEAEVPYDLELHSMTAKGIKHLCSELLEINKASQEDFQMNVHRTYLSFLRLFQEAGDLEKYVGHLKRQATAQRSLIQHLTNNLYSFSSSEQLDEDHSCKDDDDDDMLVVVDTRLDLLLSEHRMDQALDLLQEAEGEKMQQQRDVVDSPRVSTMSCAAALQSARRKARVADRFASHADNPRTPHELLRALSGLCKLGDAQRANCLLFKFHRSGVIHRVDELRQQQSSTSMNYIKELTCTVFSSILQATRCFLVLHPKQEQEPELELELTQWAKEEIQDLAVAFHEYVRSVSVSEGLVLAIQAARSALSYSCSMPIPSLGRALEQDFILLIQPCMEEALAMYAKHLNQVVRLFVSSDSWVLGRFLMSRLVIRQQSPTATATATATDYCLLTTSGRKFVTLMQEVVEDISPLLHLGVKSSLLVQLLAGLFREYIHSIVDQVIIPAEHDHHHHYMWRLSVLINCTTLLSLFPFIAHRALEGSDHQAQALHLHGLILFIKEAASNVWTQFCHHFIQDIMSTSQLQSKPTALAGGIFATSPRGGAAMMPSFVFQVLLLRVRQLRNLYGTILGGNDGTMKKLLQELMEAMINWLDNNLDFWVHEVNPSWEHQIQLDVHFLLQLAQVGGFSSDTITTSASGLLRKAAQEKVPSLEESINISGGEELAWATDAAKRAVQVLMGAEGGTSSQEEASVKSEEEEEDTQMDETGCGDDEFISMEQMDETGCGDDEFISMEDSSTDEDPLGLGSISDSDQHGRLVLGGPETSDEAAMELKLTTPTGNDLHSA